ncbi:MAG: hypothetical protein M0P22_00535 [Methanoculleus sp.]|nr:hypothetical protein [Methanoculleus sp.]
MRGGNLVLLALALGIMAISSGCTGTISVPVAHPLQIEEGPMTGVWEEILEAADLRNEAVRLESFDIRTDAGGDVDSLHILFSGVRHEKTVWYDADLARSDRIVLRQKWRPERSGSGPHPSGVFEALDVFLRTETREDGAITSAHLENGANIVFDSEYVWTFAYSDGRLHPLRLVTFPRDTMMYYLKVCNYAEPAMNGTADDRAGGGATGGGGRGYEQPCVFLLTEDQAAKASRVERLPGAASPRGSTG